MDENKVSVIIPIYQVEKFIERCVRSLMEQTLQEVEYIFVDDATPDKSIEVLEACLALYPERKATILKHPQNQGLPAARNTGLALATGEYVFHCDSDDYVEPTMLEELPLSHLLKDTKEYYEKTLNMSAEGVIYSGNLIVNSKK